MLIFHPAKRIMASAKSGIDIVHSRPSRLADDWTRDIKTAARTKPFGHQQNADMSLLSFRSFVIRVRHPNTRRYDQSDKEAINLLASTHKSSKRFRESEHCNQSRGPEYGLFLRPMVWQSRMSWDSRGASHHAPIRLRTT